MSTLLSNVATPYINSIDAKRILANQVLENIYQGQIESDGEGITQRFSSDTSGAQIRITHINPVFAQARLLGGAINGGNFNGTSREGTTNSVGLDVLYVMDDNIDLAQVSMDMLPVDLLGAYIKSYTDQVVLNLNAGTLAGKYIATELAEAEDGASAVNITTYASNGDLKLALLTANSKLDNGAEDVGVSMFPQNDRIFCIQSEYRAILLSTGILTIGGANYAYDIAKKGTIDAGAEPRKNEDGYVGMFDGVPVHIVSGLVYKTASQYAGLTKGDLQQAIGYASSGFANARAIASARAVKIVDNPNGQGVRIQPLTRFGFKVFSGYEKGNSFIMKNGYVNPYSALKTLFTLADYSSFVNLPYGSRVKLAPVATSSASTKITITCAGATKIAVCASATPITSVSEFTTAYATATVKANDLVSGTEKTISGLITDTVAYALCYASDGTCALTSITI